MKRLRWEYKSGKIALGEIGMSVNGWIAHASYADSCQLRKDIFRRFCFQKG